MLLSGVDPVQVGVLDVTGPVAPVLLPVLSDPLVCDLVEPVPVTPAPSTSYLLEVCRLQGVDDIFLHFSLLVEMIKLQLR